jgi:4-deoxy-L-threo-5-hexosulose-uronate ketol-isomerase
MLDSLPRRGKKIPLDGINRTEQIVTTVVFATHPDEMSGLTTEQLRRRFVLDELFANGEIRWALSHHDRILVGGAMPAGATLELVPPHEIRAARFCDRREVGVVCLEGSGAVVADDDEFALDAEDVAYVGQGTRSVALTGDAVFYLVSAPAHFRHPTTVGRRSDADVMAIGAAEQASARTIRKYVHEDGIASCELAMGITTLEPGSVWNTMPCHVHDRRTEVYLYFDLPPTERVIHLCGEPDKTRSLILADRQAVISPPWSVHTGAGTATYKFVWATAGENLVYNDMDPVATESLR